MPIEPQDNTKVVTPILIPQQETTEIYMPVAQLWDADKVNRYRNIQNFYNSNFWSYGNQTNYDPHTPQGQMAIQFNFNYAKNNVNNFAETLLTAALAEGAGQVIKLATTPTEIGRGAEAIVKSSPLSTKVTKVTTIPRSEMHVRNSVPGALKSEYVGSNNGLHTYIQNKVRILSDDQLQKASKQLESMMNKKGWRTITHPNMQGLGFTNGRQVVSDLGPGNVGRDWLGRLRLVDFSVESMPQFKMAMQKRGGIIKKSF